MKKRFLALVAMLCSATVCAAVGATVMGNDAQSTTVSAEAVTSTWTDSATGTTYTFEGNIEQHTTQDLGDLIQSNYQTSLATEYGMVGGAVYFGGSAVEVTANNPSMVLVPDASWATGTGGVHFQFKTDNEWYQPAGTDNTGASVASMNQDLRLGLEVWLGDIRILIYRLGGWDNSPLGATVYTYTGAKELKAHGAVAYNFFTKTNGKFLMNDYAEMKISRYKCTSANGYWLKISLLKPSDSNFNTQKIDIYNGYVAANMSKENYTHFGIRNSTLRQAGQFGYKITEAGYENYQCNLHIRRGDGRVDATLGTETYKDVADLSDLNATLANNYAMGITNSSATDRWIDKDEDFLPISNMGDGALGLEFRAKHVGNTLNTFVTNGYTNSFMLMNLGSSSVMVDYHSGWKTIAFRPFNESDWKFVGANSYGANAHSKEHSPYRFTYDVSSEYVWRMTRTPIIKKTADDGKGALVRIYLGKINTATDAPVEGWDNKPVFEYIDPYSRTMTTDSAKRGVLVRNTTLNGVANGTHTMTFSSNKYVGIKTIVGEEETVNKVVRGGDYSLTDLSEGKLIHVGWSKGADVYSASDFMKTEQQFTNLHQSATYTALAVNLDMEKTAAIRFLGKRIDGVSVPTEISLKWKATAEDISNAGYYFSGITFGYKTYASNGENSGDIEVERIANGMSTPYTYSVIQANIGEEDYSMNFSCQAWVAFDINANGEIDKNEKFYTEYVDPNGENGRSVDYVADAAIADVREAEEGIYNKLIYDVDGEEKYHYLTQEEYDLVASCGAVNF